MRRAILALAAITSMQSAVAAENCSQRMKSLDLDISRMRAVQKRFDDELAQLDARHKENSKKLYSGTISRDEMEELLRENSEITKLRLEYFQMKKPILETIRDSNKMILDLQVKIMAGECQ